MTTATQSPSSAACLALARQDPQVYRRYTLTEELMSCLEELHRANGQGESFENRLRSHRKLLAPVIAKLVVHLERQ